MTLYRIATRPLAALLLITAILILHGVPAFCAGNKGDNFFKKDVPVEITADFLTFDKESNTYYANGNVVVIQEDVTMETEGIIMNVAAGKARTAGETYIHDKDGNSVRGTDLWIDLKKNTAVIANGRIYYKRDNIYIEGDPLKKTGKDSYAGKHISYSTCDCPKNGDRRAWSFSAKEASFTLGGYMKAKHAFFKIKDYPVLYTPYLKLAVQKERQTGFLLPSPGYSELRGAVLDNAFFWAISRNRDATFYLDIETARGFGGGLEYRYIRTPESYGSLYFYNFSEKDINRVREFRKGLGNLARPASASSERWQFKFDHTEYLSAGFKINAHINIVSDDEYFVDFGQSTDKSIESLESNVSISKNWSVYSLVAQLRVFDNLLLQDDSTTLRKLPEISFTASDVKIPWTPFYRSLSSSFIHFSRSEGTTGQRLDLQPSISLPLSPGGYFDFNSSFTPRGTIYLVKENAGGRYVDRYLYTVASDLTTTFVRTFQRSGKKVNAFKHTIRPKLSYVYVPEANQNTLPSFDSVDFIPAADTVTYSLNSVLTGRYSSEGGGVAYHDYIYMELKQSYDIHEATRSRLSSTDKRRPFSDFSAEAILKPTFNSTITGKILYNVYDNWATNYDINLDLNDSRGDVLSVSHRFVRDSTNFIEGSLNVHINRLFDLSYTERYSLDERKAIESTFVGHYHHQCWGAELTYSNTLEENIVYISFSLKGIGNIGGFRAR